MGMDLIVKKQTTVLASANALKINFNWKEREGCGKKKKFDASS